MANPERWTPYGLEAIRVAHLRRRRAILAALALGFAFLWIGLFDETTSSVLEVQQLGGQNGEIRFDLPEEKRDGPVTVSLDPGRVTRADTAQAGSESQLTQTAQPPGLSRGDPYNWNYYLLKFGPYVLLGLALHLLVKRKGRRHEVNYGIYKGTMPLEMISASLSERVLTTRGATGSVFGKDREAYLPAEALVERVPQEEHA